MAEENQIDHGKNIGVLAQLEEVDQTYDTYRKNLNEGEGKDSLTKPLTDLEGLLWGDDKDLHRRMSGMTLDRNPQGIEHLIEDYKQRKAGDIKGAIEGTGDYLTDNYADILESSFGDIVEEVSSRKGFDQFTEEQKADFIKAELYKAFAAALSDLRPSNKSIVEAKMRLEKIEKATDEEKHAMIVGYLASKGTRSSKIAEWMDHDRFYNIEKAVASSNYDKAIAKELIKEGVEGHYNIDREAFKKVYGSVGNYKKMAYSLVELAKKQEAEEQAAQQQNQGAA